jgi:hypothetical protein
MALLSLRLSMLAILSLVVSISLDVTALWVLVPPLLFTSSQVPVFVPRPTYECLYGQL